MREPLLIVQHLVLDRYFCFPNVLFEMGGVTDYYMHACGNLKKYSEITFDFLLRDSLKSPEVGLSLIKSILSSL